MKLLFSVLAHVFSSIQIPIAPKPHRDNPAHSCNRSITSTRSLFQIATDARETLDFGYKKIGMQRSASFSEEEWGLAGFYLLSRRAVHLIKINHCYMFTKEEIFAANRRMVTLRERAILAANPLKLAHRRTAMLKAAVRFQAAAASEERATQEWKDAYDAALNDLMTHLQTLEQRENEERRTDMVA